MFTFAQKLIKVNNILFNINISIGMKKLLMVLAFAGVSVASMAQDAVPTEKYSVSTNSFWSNWFVQANVVGTAFWGGQEVQNNFSKSPLKGFRNNLGFSVAIGKWFTHLVLDFVQSSMVFGDVALLIQIRRPMLLSIGL